MPIETRWYDAEQTIIHNKVVGRWTVQDVMRAFANAQRLVRDGSVPDIFIWDFTDAWSAPSGLLGLGAFFSEEASPDPNYHMYLVAPSRFIRILTGIMNKLPEARIMVVETLDEMEAHIACVHEG